MTTQPGPELFQVELDSVEVHNWEVSAGLRQGFGVGFEGFQFYPKIVDVVGVRRWGERCF